MTKYSFQIKFVLIITFFISYIFSVEGQKTVVKDKKDFCVVFYCTENFYDTLKGNLKEDTCFLPASNKKWTSKRYFTKVENISKVLSSIDPDKLPEVICLSEIENKSVLQDIANSPALKNGNYAFLMEDEHDINGLGLAILYRKDLFKVISSKNINLNFLQNMSKEECTIFYIKGKVANSDTLNIFINQWRSRIGGIEKTESKRLFSAMTIRNKADSILLRNPGAKIIILGNFNDEPTNKSLNGILQAGNKRFNIQENDLYNLMYDKHNMGGTGTFYNKNTGFMFDNIIVTYSLINPDRGMKTDFNGGEIFSPDWLVSKNIKTGEISANPTYKGNRYIGGYSNHLPVFVKIKYPGK